MMALLGTKIVSFTTFLVTGKLSFIIMKGDKAAHEQNLEKRTWLRKNCWYCSNGDESEFHFSTFCSCF